MADCDSALGCSNISIMQLFHELKQKFPAVPDRVVSECIRQNFHDKDACEAILRRENQGYLLHSYPIALKMSTEQPHHPPNVCDHSLHNNEVSSAASTSVANRQMYSVASNTRPTNFGFLTNVRDNSGSGDVTYSQNDRTVSVVTYSNEQPENYQVNVNYCTTPTTRVRSALNVSPAPHYLCNNRPPQQPRSYTSVNLTLRPPSSEPQPPIDIRSAGSSLTYSTCSYDPRQGFQSHLQIRIGPGGAGSVSALRTHVPPPLPRVTPLPLQPVQVREEDEEEARTDLEPHQPFTQALLMQQLERKNKLQRELRKEKENLKTMQREVLEMRKDLEQRQRRKQTLSLPVVSTVLHKVQELRAEIQRLQEECKKMTQEVDLSLDSRVPLGETDEEFYKNIYTGQRGFILPPSPRPLPRRPDSMPGPGPGRGVQAGESGDGPHWTCSQCTFRNHPLLDKCETCEMPRIMLGSSSCYCHPVPECKTCLPNPNTSLPIMHVKEESPAEQA